MHGMLKAENGGWLSHRSIMSRQRSKVYGVERGHSPSQGSSTGGPNPSRLPIGALIVARSGCAGDAGPGVSGRCRLRHGS